MIIITLMMIEWSLSGPLDTRFREGLDIPGYFEWSGWTEFFCQYQIALLAHSDQIPAQSVHYKRLLRPKCLTKPQPALRLIPLHFMREESLQKSCQLWSLVNQSVIVSQSVSCHTLGPKSTQINGSFSFYLALMIWCTNEDVTTNFRFSPFNWVTVHITFTFERK